MCRLSTPRNRTREDRVQAQPRIIDSRSLDHRTARGHYRQVRAQCWRQGDIQVFTQLEECRAAAAVVVEEESAQAQLRHPRVLGDS